LLLTTNAAASPSHQNNSGAVLNFNSFGRSNTLDRKLKPLNTVQQQSISFSQRMSMSGAPPSTPTKSSFLQPESSSGVSNTGSPLQQQQQQRNSLISLKSPATAASQQSASVYGQLMGSGQHAKRPLSQDPIMEMSNEPSYLIVNGQVQHQQVHGLGNYGSGNYQNMIDMSGNVPATGTLSKAQLISMELENAKSQIQLLTNQLNQNVSLF
jgi:hypothetical protein